MTDSFRAMHKFGLAVGLPPGYTPEMKAADKAYSYYLSDANTPIVGAFCQTILRVCGPPKVRLGLGQFHEAEDADEQFPNEVSEWALDYAHAMVPGFDWASFERWVRLAGRSDVLHPPLCYKQEVQVKRTGFVDGEFVIGKPHDRLMIEQHDAPDRIAEQKAVADLISGLFANLRPEVPPDFEAWLGDSRADEIDLAELAAASALVQDKGKEEEAEVVLPQPGVVLSAYLGSSVAPQVLLS
jgi:hypothetical protein